MPINANNRAVQALMMRDKLRLHQAIEEVVACRKVMLEGMDCDIPPDMSLMDELGLEPDYVFDIL